MTRQQVGWYDGKRVHQMNVRPVGEVPRHLAHAAGWVPVFVEEAQPCLTCSGHGVIGGFLGPGDPCPECNAPARAPLKPSLQAEAQAVGAGVDPESIEAGDPA